MVVRKEDIHNLIERLPEDDQKTVFDFMLFLLNRSRKNEWMGSNRSDSPG